MATDGVGRDPLLERPDLRQRILSALDAGSLLLVADAGFGKTTALRDALDHGGHAAAWVRCGDAGGDAGRLLALIIEAIRETVPGAVDVLAQRMAATSEAVDPERAAGALGRELGRAGGPAGGLPRRRGGAGELPGRARRGRAADRR